MTKFLDLIKIKIFILDFRVEIWIKKVSYKLVYIKDSLEGYEVIINVFKWDFLKKWGVLF